MSSVYLTILIIGLIPMISTENSISYSAELIFISSVANGQFNKCALSVM